MKINFQMKAVLTAVSIDSNNFSVIFTLLSPESFSLRETVQKTKPFIKINESHDIALLVVSGFIKKLFSIDYINIYLLPIFFQYTFCLVKKCGDSHIVYIV